MSLSYSIYGDNKSLPIETAYSKARADETFEKICSAPGEYGITWEVKMIASPSGEVIKTRVIASWTQRLEKLRKLEEMYP